MMSRLANPKWRETVAGLALFLTFPVLAQGLLSEPNYVLIIDKENPELSRLLVFSEEAPSLVLNPLAYSSENDDEDTALSLTRSTNMHDRVRGLTLLSGVDGASALHTALALFSDPAPAVREEALQVIFWHPEADIESAIAIGENDPSIRVRELTAELIAERSGE